nr:GHKL domain-containing protein [Sedimentibacter sp.]
MRIKISNGMGVRSIKRIVEKYDGIINYYEKGNILSCNILLLKKKA